MCPIVNWILHHWEAYEWRDRSCIFAKERYDDRSSQPVIDWLGYGKNNEVG